MKRVFILNHDEAMLYAYADYLKAKGYDVFATTNDYKFMLYAKEIDADIFIIDTKKPYDIALFKKLEKEHRASHTPILLLTDYAERFFPHKAIAHVLFKPFDLRNFDEIIEAYGVGKKSHNLLLVEKFKSDDYTYGEQSDLSVFKIYNMPAANSYLEKNSPANIVINLEPEDEYDTKELFYVENQKKLQDRAAVLD